MAPFSKLAANSLECKDRDGDYSDCDSVLASSRDEAGLSDVTKMASSDESDQEQFAKKETQNVFRLRLMVILVLVLTAGAISFMVFRLTDKAEAEEFETQFEGAAAKIISCE